MLQPMGGFPCRSPFSVEKPILPQDVRFNQAICVYVRKTFSVYCLKFVEHQMLSTFKEFRNDCHRHFKKYSDPEKTRANPPHILYELVEQKRESVDHVELFWQTHVRDGTFVLQATEDAHNQMLVFKFVAESNVGTLVPAYPEGIQPLSRDEICEMVLGR
ncbi:CACTA en-spm transposon protein [Cucumis melo var. makuwa]|uniref:CACTA en-spm transposon protein n=1 Tax=Cucumis melo var. makuwa TaxID=1194695 RepID=A0A5A7VIH6_CUCMM|nr:CACTA en-spm transposon protein [Cucumis melo var. makuwa]TYK30228.1 CACTA en-spm transposon protein [Cucumis melo var. makuwa]